MAEDRSSLSPKIEIFPEKETIIFKPKGIWRAKYAKEAQPLCDEIATQSFEKPLIFDLAELTELDTSGIWLIQHLLKKLKKQGHHISLRHQSEPFRALSSKIIPYESSPAARPKPPSQLFHRVEAFGRACVEIAQLTLELIAFLGFVVQSLFLTLLNPKRLRFISLVAHMEKMGVNAVPIVSLMSISLGLVLAFQGEEQLRKFGAEIYTINLVSISILREVGILITAIIVAGRTGSAITAQIGIMKVNQEIDALNTLGLSPMDVLILPRVLALILVMPLLAFVSDIMGLIGGGIMVVLSQDVSPQLYIQRIGEAVTLGSFWVGILKAPLFGAIIGVVSCFEGMRVKGTAESIGIHTTRSVVEGIFLVTLADALLSVFFSLVGI